MPAKRKFLHYLLLLLQFIFCTSLDNFTETQTFKEGNLLVSKGNKFAFGFFSPGSSNNRYLGIWFHEVSEPSVVWVANRNNPLSGSTGFLSINQYGNLVLYSNPDQKVLVWSTNISVEVSDACVAQLLDTGNLVLLQSRSKRILWQSFDYPTDTLIPGMKIGQNWKAGMNWILTSWISANDPGSGDYSLELNPRGSPQFLLYKDSRIYWRSIPWPWRKISDVYNYSYVNNEEEAYYFYHMFDASVIMRGVVDNSGFIKWLRWQKSEGRWKEFWSVPKYQCDLYAQCGVSSKCTPGSPDIFECSCLPGYEPKSPNDWNLRDASKGCIKKQQDPSSLCDHRERFVKVGNVKVPDTSAAVWVNKNLSLLGCEQECKKNCSCSAYATIDIVGRASGCLTWYGQLWDTVDHIDERYDLYIRVDGVEPANNESKSNAFLGKEQRILTISVGLAWFTVFFFAYLWLRRRRKGMRNKWENKVFDPINGSIYYKNTMVACELGGNSHPPDITFFDLSTIVVATNSFSPTNKLGQGGFGSVYREIAVKQLSKNSVQGIEEFKNEAMLIAKLQHRNLVKLLGCCIQGGEKILIYEYLPNKSLDSFLFDETKRSSLDWSKRFDIIIGIARGILYLHQDSRLRIIHRDLKCSNILLDSEMNPKISDFGTARIFRADQIQEKTNRVVGTYGYMSPEYAVFGQFSVKSDVFSFGVVLLEIVSGKKSNGCNQENPSICLIGQVWELWREDNVLEIVDSILEESYPPDEVLRCIQIALLCVQENAVDRPTMLEVVLMLSSETAIPSPKKPAFIFRASSSSNTNTLKVVGEGSSSVNEVTITTFVAR
ncbi:G-type lectin S-receptor-like serine/threonine-protein kinase RKS1 isoform X2 [Manihot esculenta]|uniref:G-type lectin S-receptor-like serine/threonine-protein kinase RKS1 isoform X2 n=1 Tax=Manihot esculenta TaxID=3983 RepID=UPI001CC5796C|nr:G-type lectin S-receptor-like serine/threonine-protein kinase RKS1 isoform X2 [Manihot esculenta]